jgi:hypothetical protein
MRAVQPFELVELAVDPTIAPSAGFHKLYYKGGYLTTMNASAIPTDVVLDRPLDNFLAVSTAIPINAADTVLQAFNKIQGTFNNIRLVGEVTGTAVYNAGFLEINCIVASSAITIDITDGVTTETVNDGETITFADSSSIDFVISAVNTVSASVIPGAVDHDLLLNFVANEHIDHSSVILTAGIGLSGGGDITVNRTFDLDIPSLPALTDGGVLDPADTFAVYNASATAHEEVTFAQLVAAIGTPNLQAVTDVGNSTTNTIIANKFESDTIQVTGGIGTQGTMTWNTSEATLELVNNGSTTLIGQDFHYHVRNNTGGLLAKGTVVQATGTIGGSGKITVGPYLADGSTPSKYLIGVLQEDIANSQEGKVHGKGKITGLNTTGGLSAGGLETWIDGDVLYCDPNNTGLLTNVKPEAPNQKIPIAFVIYAHASQGILQVRTQPDQSLSDNEEVQISAVQDVDLLTWSAANSRWENASLATLGIATTTQLGDYLPLAGGTMTGDIVMNTNSLVNSTTSFYLGTAPYGYAVVETNNDSGSYLLYNNVSGFTGRLTRTVLTADHTWTFPNATGTVALISDLNSYLPLAGGTMTGDIIQSIAPTLGTHLTNKDYVDSLVQGIDWKESVIDEIDFTSAEPGSPNVGDRYINTATGNSSGTTQAVTVNYIYEWNGVDWTEIAVNEGATTRNETSDTIRHFDGVNWINLGSAQNHNSLSGLQGGTANEYYHLTSAQHTIATQAATTSLSGYLTSTDWNTFNDKSESASGLLDTWTLISGNDYYQDFTHNLGTEDVVVEIYNSTTKKTVIPGEIERLNTNTVRISVSGNSTDYRITVVK